MDREDDVRDVLLELEELDRALYEEYRDRCYTVLARTEELRKLSRTVNKVSIPQKRRRHMVRKIKSQ